MEVAERVPDSVLRMADEVVNIDLTSDELITRLKEGKIYAPEKIQIALNNFFQGRKNFTVTGTGIEGSSFTGGTKGRNGVAC